MKRVLIITFVLCLLFTYGCSAQPTQETPETTAGVEKPADTQVQNTPDTPVDPEPQPEPEPPKPQYTHPLTGEALDAPYTGRPTAVVLGNTKKALPQHGIGKADMVYEAVVEGSMTRFLVIFDEFSDVEKIGPVRSLRTFFTSVGASYDAPVMHCGGSEKALKGYHDINNKISNWEHIDQRFNGKYFYRDEQRKSQGYSLEHRLFTTGEMLTKALEAKNFNTVNENGVSYGLQFADAPELTGESANKITVKFKGGKTTDFTLNDAGLYEAYQHKTTLVDGETGEAVAFRNVFVLLTKHKTERDKNYPRSFYTLTGSGEGYFACDGKIVEIKWTRETVNDSFSYTLADGTPLTLGVGKSYTAIVADSDSAGVTYQ